jgi:23S rRNA A2030 N6-methylase RlmJ
VLLAVAGAIQVDGSVLYVESHSGAPVHKLEDGGEWQRGAGRVVASSACQSEYRAAVTPWLGRQEYPASWVLVAKRFAERGKTVGVELADTSDAVAKAHEQWKSSPLGENVQVNFRRSDGFDLAINTAAPTLVFLDPPFEDREREWQLLAGTCMFLREHNIPFLAWYPYSWHTFPNWIVETTQCLTWEVLWAKCGAKPSQNLKGCGMLVSDCVADVLQENRSTLEPLPACLGWELRVR